MLSSLTFRPRGRKEEPTDLRRFWSRELPLVPARTAGASRTVGAPCLPMWQVGPRDVAASAAPIQARPRGVASVAVFFSGVVGR